MSLRVSHFPCFHLTRIFIVAICHADNEMVAHCAREDTCKCPRLCHKLFKALPVHVYFVSGRHRSQRTSLPQHPAFSLHTHSASDDHRPPHSAFSSSAKKAEIFLNPTFYRNLGRGRFGTSHGVMTGKTGPRKSAAGHVQQGWVGLNAAASQLPPKGRFGPKAPHATHHPAAGRKGEGRLQQQSGGLKLHPRFKFAFLPMVFLSSCGDFDPKGHGNRDFGTKLAAAGRKPISQNPHPSTDLDAQTAMGGSAPQIWPFLPKKL